MTLFFSRSPAHTEQGYIQREPIYTLNPHPSYVHHQRGGGVQIHVLHRELGEVLRVQCVASTCAVLAWDRVINNDYNTYNILFQREQGTQHKRRYRVTKLGYIPVDVVAGQWLFYTSSVLCTEGRTVISE